jgi:hypothetical protein
MFSCFGFLTTDYAFQNFKGAKRALNLILSIELTRVTKYNEVEKVNIRGTNLGFE